MKVCAQCGSTGNGFSAGYRVCKPCRSKNELVRQRLKAGRPEIFIKTFRQDPVDPLNVAFMSWRGPVGDLDAAL